MQAKLNAVNRRRVLTSMAWHVSRRESLRTYRSSDDWYVVPSCTA